MPAYCAPPPGIMNTTDGAAPLCSWLTAALASVERSNDAASVALAATTARRARNALRPTRRVYATSARSVSG